LNALASESYNVERDEKMTREDWVLNALSEVRKAFDDMFALAEDLYKRFVPEEQRSRAEHLYKTYVPELGEQRSRAEHLYKTYVPKLMAKPQGAVRIPDVDVIDLGSEIHLVADMPGVKKEDIDIDLAPDTVVITAGAEAETGREEQVYAHRERKRSAYRRKMHLPEPIVPDQAKARFNNGVLEIIMPRKEPAEQVKTVKVDIKDVGELT
jgi:HSP20 family molecular chaperone IbpA